MKRIGFKEWAIVCEALGSGRQSVLLRKGGIAEGREGFAFRHEEFFLFPTFFHEQMEKTRLTDAAIPKARAGEIEIRFWAKLEMERMIRSAEEIKAIEPLHILAEEVVRERFHYGDPVGLHAGLIRVFRLDPVWIFPDAKTYGGCRSWVELPEFPKNTEMQPVLADNEHRRRVQAFEQAFRKPGPVISREV